MVNLKYKLTRNFKHYFSDLELRLSGAYSKKPRVSVCTSTKDRLEHIQETFLRNIKDNEQYPDCEFLLLNYTCPNPKTEEWVKGALEAYISSGRVNYYYYPDSQTFDRSHARNLAFRLAQGDILCNVDADNFTGKGFVEYLAASLSCDNAFLSGPRDGRGLGGRICLRRKDWIKVGGFDERFKSYGPEDLDLTNRLSLIGLENKTILYEGFCKSIAHSDALRTKHHIQVDYEKEYWDILNDNLNQGVACPNGISFGHGRVQKNFSDWLDV